MMRVLHVIDSGGLYGAERVGLDLMSEQVKMGLKPVLASIGAPHDGEKAIETEARARGLHVESFRMRPGPNWAGAHRILRFAWMEGIELIHSHGYKGNILFGLLPSKIRRVPIVSTLHGWTWSGDFNRMMAYEILDGLSLRFINRVVLVSEAMKAHPRLKRLPPEKIAVIENGIPLNASQHGRVILRQEIVEFACKGFSIIAVGRLSPEKGFGFLLEAISALGKEGRDVWLAILGHGALRRDLEQKAKGLGIGNRVLFGGYVEAARNYMGHFSLFCMPSLTEGLPIVLLEAMASGVPVVATRAGGISEVLDYGRAGLLIKSNDVRGFKSAIVSIMDDAESAQRRACLAAERVREKYSSRSMALEYGRIYRKLLSCA